MSRPPRRSPKAAPDGARVGFFHRINGWVLRRNAGQIFWTIAALDVALVALIVTVWTLSSDKAVFTFDVQTELLEAAAPPGASPPNWGDVDLADGADAFCRGARFRIAERAANGMTIQLKAVDTGIEAVLDAGAEPAGEVLCPGEAPGPSPSYVVLHIGDKAGAPATLRIGGNLTLGAEPPARSHATTLLREGALRVQAKSWPFPSNRVGDETSLQMGDTVRFFTDRRGREQAIGYALIRRQDGALHVAGQVIARQAHVQRVGQHDSDPISFAPSALARLQAQAEWAILGILGTLGLNLLGAWGVLVASPPSRKR